MPTDVESLIRRMTGDDADAPHAVTTRDRQLVEVAVTRVAGDEDRFDALVRDHLADHSDSILAAWIAARDLRAIATPPSQ